MAQSKPRSKFNWECVARPENSCSGGLCQIWLTFSDIGKSPGQRNQSQDHLLPSRDIKPWWIIWSKWLNQSQDLMQICKFYHISCDLPWGDFCHVSGNLFITFFIAKLCEFYEMETSHLRLQVDHMFKFIFPLCGFAVCWLFKRSRFLWHTLKGVNWFSRLAKVNDVDRTEEIPLCRLTASQKSPTDV